MDRADCQTAHLVASWTVIYGGEYTLSNEAKRLRRQVGTTDNIALAMQELKDNFTQGARTLAADEENWAQANTFIEAKQFVNTIDEMKGLTVVQWNSFQTWQRRSAGY